MLKTYNISELLDITHCCVVEERTFNNREESLVVCHRKIREETRERNENREKEK